MSNPDNNPFKQAVLLIIAGLFCAFCFWLTYRIYFKVPERGKYPVKTKENSDSSFIRIGSLEELDTTLYWDGYIVDALNGHDSGTAVAYFHNKIVARRDTSFHWIILDTPLYKEMKGMYIHQRTKDQWWQRVKAEQDL